MQNRLFGWTEDKPLVSVLTESINTASVSLYAGRPNILTLGYGESSYLKIIPKIIDLSEDEEVGALSFELTTQVPDSDAYHLSFRAAIRVLSAETLIAPEPRCRVEAGVILNTDTHSKIVVVAAAFPYTLAIRGLFEIPHGFEPEYDLDQYAKEAMR